MSYILKGKYVYTSYDADNAGLLRDGAVYFDGQTIREVGGVAELCRKYPEATVLGGDDYAVLPGLIDAHTHGSGLSYVQRGPGFDYLENSQWEWPGAVVLPPELNAPLPRCAICKTAAPPCTRTSWGSPATKRRPKPPPAI